MKRIAFALFFALATTATFAQGPAVSQQEATAAQAGSKSLEQRANEITIGMAKHLRLTPDQTQKIKAINLKSMQNAEEAKIKFQRDPQKIVKQMDVISQSRISLIKDVLTPLQFQQYQQRREEKMGVPREAQSNPSSRHESSLNQESY
ncbi:hypothetical protein [Pontibacter pamirensis]|uniref:hypothetical protein n=1 Tax=Pontibacter pamirensis TaxID=2562824 RepID=UPI00138A469F|nr:hypothetical protein [Pontibacter pamirensis]